MPLLGLLGFAAALAAEPAAAPAPGAVAAVLSSDAAYYTEALEGFRAEMGADAPATVLPAVPAWPAGVKVVVAFGARAVRADPPKGAVLVYALAPGTRVEPGRRAVRVAMMPPAPRIIGRLKELMPDARTLAVFWTSAPFEETVRAMREAGSASGIKVWAERVAGEDELPDRLRALRDEPDAIWLPPDPALVTPQNFAVLREYSWARGVPLVAPTAGLAERGAAIALASSYREIGRAAARAAQAALARGRLDAVAYPERLETAINPGAAAKAGLKFTAAAVSSADRVFGP